MSLSLDHAALWVKDLEKMRAFYVDVLGGAAGPRYRNGATGFESYFITFGGSRIELMHRSGLDAAPAREAHGYAHVALSAGSRSEVDSRAEALRQAGVEVVSPPRQTGDGYYEAVILDPEGNRIEIVA